MQFRIGAVYRNKTSQVYFVAVQYQYDDATNVLKFFLVNIVNWIILDELTGKILTNGDISCQGLAAEAYDCVATNLIEYYSDSQRGRSTKPDP